MNNYLKKYKKNMLKYSPEPTSMDELAQVVIDTVKRTLAKKQPTCKVIGFAWELCHGDVRNSHDCPINGVQNWGGREEHAPKSYPGWNGRVWIRLSESPNHFSSKSFDESLTYPGTGGAGSYRGPWEQICSAYFNQYKHHYQHKGMGSMFSWDYRLYDSDWPKLQEVKDIEKYLMWAVLRNSKYTHPTHKFCWTDLDTLKEDEAFFNQINNELQLTES